MTNDDEERLKFPLINDKLTAIFPITTARHSVRSDWSSLNITVDPLH